MREMTELARHELSRRGRGWADRTTDYALLCKHVPSSSAVVVTSISILWMLDHLLGASCQTLIVFEGEVENMDCIHRHEVQLLLLRGYFFVQEDTVTKDVAELSVPSVNELGFEAWTPLMSVQLCIGWYSGVSLF
ncbi:hypothetical protein EV421DRAFT_1912994 [Armillaria borealis]|uniref:Uncharacterized protein n=1 Tax=Armillaria borealis TaxID=47425 RepID=A0AA39IWT9_9AGAR|nr:hypothetical protein EV421DRAFT_1912994 [Armillaria borealis]